MNVVPSDGDVCVEEESPLADYEGISVLTSLVTLSSIPLSSSPLLY